MATQAPREKQQKPQQGEVPRGQKNEATLAPGHVFGRVYQDPVALVPTAPSHEAVFGDTDQSSTAGSATSAVVSTACEDPVLPSMDSMSAKRRVDLQDSRGSQASLRREEPETSGQEQPQAQKKSPENKRRKKQPSQPNRDQAEKPTGRHLLPGASAQASVPPPPSSQPRRRRRGGSQASTWNHATGPGPALRSQALRADSALCSGTTVPGHGTQSHASTPGPAHRNRATPPGPVLRSSASRPRPALRRRASPPGPVLRSGASRPSPDQRHASAPGPGLRRRSTAPGPVLRSGSSRLRPVPQNGASQRGSDLRSHVTRPGPALRCPVSAPATNPRSRATRPGADLHSGSTSSVPVRTSASRPDTTLRRPATKSGPTPSSTTSTTGLGPRRRRPTLQRSSGRSAISIRGSLRNPGVRRPPPSSRAPLQHVFQSSSSSSEREVGSPPSQSVWHAVRMRASSPSPPGLQFPDSSLTDLVLLSPGVLCTILISFCSGANEKRSSQHTRKRTGSPEQYMLVS
ncbi:EZH inhibitory protein [Marmota marmota marmota]|uniref:EZH inhibitory protein n=1 Tax=Marmota marmota marmota TaxID=9994 RepID=UPI002093A1C7|nr:EZH inhibitory protein [Marmota marmota marmota]